MYSLECIQHQYMNEKNLMQSTLEINMMAIITAFFHQLNSTFQFILMGFNYLFLIKTYVKLFLSNAGLPLHDGH